MSAELSERSAIISRSLGGLDRILHNPAPTLVERIDPPAIPARRARVSVIIPCYNYGHFLPFSVHSAVNQVGCIPEVIIVDDASTDGSLEVAHRLERESANVIVIENPENQGHVQTFNNGLKVATGEFIVRLDADDLLTPACLSRSTALFDNYRSVGLVYGRPRHFSSPTPPSPVSTDPKWTVWRGDDWVRERCARGVNCITTPEAMVRSSVFHSIGALSTKLRYAQDMEIWLRVAAVSDVGYISGPDQALHRDHDASMSVTAGSGILVDLIERRTVFEVLFDGPGGALPDAQRLARSAKRRLAREALRHVCHSYDRNRFSEELSRNLIDFALTTDPGVLKAPEWAALKRRERLGQERVRRNPLFAAHAVLRRIAFELAFARWLRTGT